MTDPEQGGITIRNCRLKLPGLDSRHFRRTRQPGQRFTQAGRPAAANVGFSDEEIGQDAGSWQNHHDQHPGYSGGWFPVRAENSPSNGGQMDED
jgi:hypothetical protein